MRLATKEKTKTYAPQRILDIGHNVLVENLGLAKTAEFMMSAFAGQGDSVEYYRQMRAGKTVAQTVKEINKAKREGII